MVTSKSPPVLAVLREALDYIVMCIDIMIKLMDPHYFIWQIDWISQIPVLQQELMEAIRSEFSSISYATLRFKMCNMERITTLGAATLLFDNFFTNKSEKNRLFTYNKGILNKRE